MFVNRLRQSNPRLIQAAVELHQSGRINPNTYVLDLDSIEDNTRAMAKVASENGIQLYGMTKQIGRNPLLAQRIAQNGIEKAVAVDPWEAISLARAGIQLGNVGHLVQVPTAMLQTILQFHPEVFTVFSVEKAEQISKVCQDLGIRQKLLLKVVGPQDMVYDGQLGGFKLEHLPSIAQVISSMPNVSIAGVTTFPALLYDYETGSIRKTENAHTLMRAVEILGDQGYSLEQINAPSATAISTIPMLKEMGATHGEPGHSLTGTTPLHAHGQEKERVALVYVSEISHKFDDMAFVYGGGFYRRSHVGGALVGKTYPELLDNYMEAVENNPEAIDYHGTLKTRRGKADVGDTAIYSFRSQIFVTRSNVAVVEGIQRGKLRLLGLYDNLGREIG